MSDRKTGTWWWITLKSGRKLPAQYLGYGVWDVGYRTIASDKITAIGRQIEESKDE